jgi:hypothetical protein
LDEEEKLVQLRLVEEDGMVCGGAVGPMFQGRFCGEKLVEGVSTCGKVKAHLARKQEGLEPGWFIGVGERPLSGVLLKPRLDVEKIPWRAWTMLLGPEAPMKAPKAVWQALFDMAEGNPAPLLGAGASTTTSMRDGTPVVEAELLLAKKRMAQEYGEGDESPGFEPKYDELEIGTQEGHRTEGLS